MAQLCKCFSYRHDCIDDTKECYNCVYRYNYDICPNYNYDEDYYKNDDEENLL